MGGGTPIFWGSIGQGDVLYTPAGTVVMDSPGPEDSIGVRIPIIPQWDSMAAQEFTACQADWTQRTKTGNPMVEKTLAYITRMGIESGAKPDVSQLTWLPAFDDRASTAPMPLMEAARSPKKDGHAATPVEKTGEGWTTLDALPEVEAEDDVDDVVGAGEDVDGMSEFPSDW